MVWVFVLFSFFSIIHVVSRDNKLGHLRGENSITHLLGILVQDLENLERIFLTKLC